MIKSLLRVFKPISTVSSDEVVMISDLVLDTPSSGKNGELSEDGDPEQTAGDGEAQENETPVPVISAEEVALNRAKEMAEELSAKILRSAHDERDDILEQARAEAAHLRDQAIQEGYQNAYHEMRSQIEQSIASVSSTLDELQQTQQHFTHEYEENLRFLAVDIAEKVLNKKIAQDDSEIIELVKQAVSSVKNADWISVEISDKLQGLIEKLEVTFADQAGERHIDFSAVDGPIGTCVIHTDEAVIDASVPVQMENVRELFEKM